jgi:transposase
MGSRAQLYGGKEPDVMYGCCCGLDIHKDSVVACCVNENGKKEIRSFGTMTDDLIGLCGWLKEKKVEMTAMESTASYWKPIFNLLEAEDIPAMLVNAQHVKNVPGRKTDVKDAEWLANLLRHGLLKASFVQKRAGRELKELVRYKNSIIEERAREYNRLDKVLQGANIKLSSVASSLDTKSGMDMCRAIAKGEFNPQVLSEMARGTMKSKTEELKRALRGFIQPHQRMIIDSMLNHIASLNDQISSLDKEIDKRMSDESGLVSALDEITGVGKDSAQVILSEIGTDMSQFPTSKHLVSWSGLCPGNNESAGKKKHGKTRKGNPTLRKTLAQCGRAAANSKNTYLNSMYKRIAARRGKNVACIAVGRAILEICYYMIRDKTSFRELGADYFAERNRNEIMKRSLKRIESLGFKVTVEDIESDKKPLVS